MKNRTAALFAGFTVLCLFVLGTACSSAGDKAWTGIWRGTVIFVNVEYTFTENTFEMKTTSANDVVVAAAKGPIKVEGDTMYITETDRYYFDNATNTGAWKQSAEKPYKASVKIDGGQMTFQPETSQIALELTKQ
jgi:hypothetical protein